jgi:hypothetical protein
MPALLDTTVRSFTPLSLIASIRLAGMPHRPKPPAMMVMPSRSTPLNAAVASAYTLLTAIPRSPATDPLVASCHRDGRQATR